MKPYLDRKERLPCSHHYSSRNTRVSKNNLYRSHPPGLVALGHPCSRLKFHIDLTSETRASSVSRTRNNIPDSWHSWGPTVSRMTKQRQGYKVVRSSGGFRGQQEAYQAHVRVESAPWENTCKLRSRSWRIMRTRTRGHLPFLASSLAILLPHLITCIPKSHGKAQTKIRERVYNCYSKEEFFPWSYMGKDQTPSLGALKPAQGSFVPSVRSELPLERSNFQEPAQSGRRRPRPFYRYCRQCWHSKTFNSYVQLPLCALKSKGGNIFSS